MREKRPTNPLVCAYKWSAPIHLFGLRKDGRMRISKRITYCTLPKGHKPVKAREGKMYYRHKNYGSVIHYEEAE